MGETQNISKMASRISEEIFSVFGWEKFGPVNSRWECVTESHKRTEHPTDVSFRYDDPYNRNRTVNVLTDLKSYAASTINKAKIKGALNDLCETLTCALRGPGWKEKYATDDVTANTLVGMLFVYDHSRSYESDLFASIFADVDVSDYVLPPQSRVVIFSPQTISALHTIATDIRLLREKKELPSAKNCQFWYPDLVTARLQDNEPKAASVEMLTGPWVSMRHKAGKATHFTFWHQQGGSSVDDFQYLFDSFFRYQLLTEPNTFIQVRFLSPERNARSHFDGAKTQYATRLYNFPRDRLEAITFERVPNVTRFFDETILEWEKE